MADDVRTVEAVGRHEQEVAAMPDHFVTAQAAQETPQRHARAETIGRPGIVTFRVRRFAEPPGTVGPAVS